MLRRNSTASLAKEILGKIATLRELMASPADSNLAIIAALNIGELRERSHWMWLHSRPAIKGRRRMADEQLAQQRGAAANREKGRDRRLKIARALKEKLSADQLGALSDSALAKLLPRDYGGSDSTRRAYIAQARKEGFLPPRMEM